MVLYRLRDQVCKPASVCIWCSTLASHSCLKKEQKHSGYSHWPKENAALEAECVINSSEGAISHCFTRLLEAITN